MKTKFNEVINRKNAYVVKWLGQDNEQSLPFWIADGDYATYNKITKKLIETSRNETFGYTIIPDAFKSSIVKWYRQNYHSEIDIATIIPSTGVILEIRIILELITKLNEGIIIQTPVYHVFHHLIKNLGRQIVENKLIKKDDTYYIDFVDLEEKFKQGNKVLILCSPHNPVGRIWNKDELAKISRLIKKYNGFLIVDEIHSDLNITSKKFNSMIDFTLIKDQMVICNAPSKAFNIAGLNTSYIIIPNNQLRTAFINKTEIECLNRPDIFGINALIEAYSFGKNWIKAQNSHLRDNYLFLKAYLNEKIPNALVTKLEGTYLVWIDLSYTKLSSIQLDVICKNKFLTISTGAQFGSDYESYIRFNISCSKNQLEEGLKRLVEAITNEA